MSKNNLKPSLHISLFTSSPQSYSPRKQIIRLSSPKSYPSKKSLSPGKKNVLIKIKSF